MSVSVAPAFKAALYAACQTLYPTPSLVCYGNPGALSANDIVGVMNVSSQQDVATMSNLRRREETLTVEVIFSCWRGGLDQKTVTERAYTMLGQLETYLQDSGNTPSTQITLGGVVRECRVISHDLAETANPDDLAVGRIAEITAVVVAHARI